MGKSYAEKLENFLPEIFGKKERPKVKMTIIKATKQNNYKPKYKVEFVDVLIASAFLPKPKENAFLYHKNGNYKSY